VADYLHNAGGQRVAKTVGAAATHYVYDMGGNLIAEADGGTGVATAEYVWLGGMPLAYIQGGATYFVHPDHLNTPQRVTDAAAAVVWDADYRPFGAATVTGALTFNLRFPGQYADAETGLHYNYFRDYDASTGRYIQSDPIGLLGGWNTYAYVGGNPVMRVDPNGLRVLNPENKTVTLRSFYALQRLNACIGCNKDIIITSGIRPQNATVGAGSRSQHVVGHAVDFKVPGMTHLELAQKTELCGVFGGVGWYEEGLSQNGMGPHVHGDSRQGRFRWGYYADGTRTRGYIPNDPSTIVSIQTFPNSCDGECPSF
jgi:RHS repeat-associated protein